MLPSWLGFLAACLPPMLPESLPVRVLAVLLLKAELLKLLLRPRALVNRFTPELACMAGASTPDMADMPAIARLDVEVWCVDANLRFEFAVAIAITWSARSCAP